MITLEEASIIYGILVFICFIIAPFGIGIIGIFWIFMQFIFVGPEQTIKNYIKALNERDLEKASVYVTASSQAIFETAEEVIRDRGFEYIAFVEPSIDCRETMNGKSCNVCWEGVIDESCSIFSLVQDNGEWLIDLKKENIVNRPVENTISEEE